MKRHRRLRRSIWLPPLLLLYFLIMSVYFGRDWIQSGRTLQFSLMCVAELIVITLLWFFLRRRERFGRK